MNQVLGTQKRLLKKSFSIDEFSSLDNLILGKSESVAYLKSNSSN